MLSTPNETRREYEKNQVLPVPDNLSTVNYKEPSTGDESPKTRILI